MAGTGRWMCWEAAGARVHLARPLGVKGFAYRRVKNDVRDAADLCDLLRMGRLPEAYIASRGERELVRHRAKLVALRSGLKAQVHRVAAKQSLLPPCSDVFGVAGMAWLRRAPLDLVYRQRVLSLLELIDAYGGEVEGFRAMIARRFRDHRGYRVLQQISGIGPTFAAVFIAEISAASGMTPVTLSNDFTRWVRFRAGADVHAIGDEIPILPINVRFASAARRHTCGRIA